MINISCGDPKSSFEEHSAKDAKEHLTSSSPLLRESRLEALAEIETRVLWLSTAIINHANRVRPNVSGIKVGGHQASSASMTTIMTSLWFGQLKEQDRVSVKPHASPVLHSINYLLGNLDEKYMTTLRQIGGLQSYPSRAKDPDPADYSTGSVGIGATAPIWGAVSRRYAAKISGNPSFGRQYSLVGDAELDEGAIWEAVLDSGTVELGELVWIVDLNRQSLDRVVPNVAAGKIEMLFESAGWQVITVRFGRLLESIFQLPDGETLRERIITMSNPEYQRLLRCTAEQVRERLPGVGDKASTIASLISALNDETLLRAIRNLGGHDLDSLQAAYAEIDDTRPTVIIAYTIKGHRLPTEGHPQNHSSLLTTEQFETLGEELGEDPASPFSRFDSDSTAGRLCAETASSLERMPHIIVEPPSVPRDFGRTPGGTATTQSALGRALLDLTRAAPEAAAVVVTVSPDVSSSTNLGGWLNKVGVWSVNERQDWFSDDTETIMHWREKPTGQHIELGIAETNMVGLLGELGTTWSRWSQPLFPIGVLYDPFVERALEPWSYGIYAGGQSILVGTPSGVTLAPEGGAHQSIKTPSIGLEQPGCISYEPAFAIDTEWVLLASLSRLGRVDGTSSYLRLSTKPVDQSLAHVPEDPAAREERRLQVTAGGYVLSKVEDPVAMIVTMGAMVPEALEAATRLTAQGLDIEVVCVTSPGLLFRAIQERNGLGTKDKGHIGEGLIGDKNRTEHWILDQIFPQSKSVPMVTVLDGHPHTLAFLGGINRVPMRNLGVSTFGQSGDLEDVYRSHGIDTDSIIHAILDLIP